MTKEDKLILLRKVREHITAYTSQQFICLIVDEIMADGMFKELEDEITRTGLEQNPDYDFPNALGYKDSNGVLRGMAQSISGYNKKKLELIDRVIKELNDDK